MSEVLPMKREVPFRGIGAETMVRDPERKLVHFLNPTAAIIWECLDGVSTLADCEQRIREKVTVPPEVDLAADIQGVIADFRAKNLLVEG